MTIDNSKPEPSRQLNNKFKSLSCLPGTTPPAPPATGPTTAVVEPSDFFPGCKVGFVVALITALALGRDLVVDGLVDEARECEEEVRGAVLRAAVDTFVLPS